MDFDSNQSLLKYILDNVRYPNEDMNKRFMNLTYLDPSIIEHKANFKEVADPMFGPGMSDLISKLYFKKRSLDF